MRFVVISALFMSYSAAEASPEYAHDNLEEACRYFLGEALSDVVGAPVRNVSLEEFSVSAGESLGRYKLAGWLNARAEVGSFGTKPLTGNRIAVFEADHELSFGAICRFDLIDRRVLSIEFTQSESLANEALNPELRNRRVEAVPASTYPTGNQIHGGKY